MNIYAQLALVSLVAVYIVDLSGFTQSWRRALAKALGIAPDRLRKLPPFDCGRCATWWATLAWAYFAGQLTLPVVAFCAVLSHFTTATGSVLNAVREILIGVFNRIADFIETQNTQ